MAIEEKSLKEGFAQSGKILEALSSKIRQDIILELAKCYPNGLRINEIHLKKCITRPTMSFHMKLLLRAELVSYKRVGTKNYYSLSIQPGKLNQVIDVFHQLQEVVGDSDASSN